jgi:hypothetical protein
MNPEPQRQDGTGAAAGRSHDSGDPVFGRPNVALRAVVFVPRLRIDAA